MIYFTPGSPAAQGFENESVRSSLGCVDLYGIIEDYVPAPRMRKQKIKNAAPWSHFPSQRSR
jgi:hypothetical protein